MIEGVVHTKIKLLHLPPYPKVRWFLCLQNMMGILLSKSHRSRLYLLYLSIQLIRVILQKLLDL